MDVFEAIKTRRSVRRYKETTIKEEDLRKVLEAGQWAASWANTQCWRFVIVTDSSIKDELVETLTPANPARTAIKQAPVVIVACAERGKAGFYKGEATTDKGDWFMFDVALAASNMTLAARALGLGTVHVGLFDAPKAARAIGVPDNVSVVEILPLGYPDEEPRIPRRKELSEIVFYNKYGATT